MHPLTQPTDRHIKVPPIFCCYAGLRFISVFADTLVLKAGNAWK